MNELRRLWGWFVLALLFGWAGLSVFGAFLGADVAKSLFNSPPMVVFWLVLAAAQAGGFLVFAALRRSPGLIGLHLGVLLVILGFMANSEAGHRLAARLGGREKIPWSYLRLEEGQASASVSDRSFRRSLGSLPFSVRLDKFEVEYYPLPDEPPPLLYGVLAPEPGTPHFSWATQPLRWKQDAPAPLADTPIELRVLESAPASATVELRAGGLVHRHELACPPGEPFVRLALSPIFPGLTNLHRSASLLLAQPTPPVRLYRSRVTVWESGRETPAEILVNHPLRVGGYHLYQQSWGEHPARFTVLLAVSDSGLGVTYAGFILLASGSMLCFWRRGRAS